MANTVTRQKIVLSKAKPEQGIDFNDPRQMFKAMAMDIGKEVAAYVEVMYPDAVKATSSTFLLSLRNATYNEIMMWADKNPNVETLTRDLKERSEFRRKWKAAYKKIRENK